MSCKHFQNILPGPDGIPEITAASLPRYQARIIDVREPAEVTGELGQIPGAELVPLGTLDAAAVSWSKDEPLVVVCRSGGRSGRAVRALRERGFRCVVNLQGGMLSYRMEA